LGKRFRSAIHKGLIITFLGVISSMQASDDRAERVGEGLICMCSCNQLLSGCEMINCSSAPPMRRELRGYIDKGMEDKTILATFASKYGPKVLSAPSTKGWFNLSAWVMPFAALAAGGIVVIFFLKRIRSRSAVADGPTVDAARYEKEIEEELRKLTPED
jgi:cytochrome c-type biogenesis protein CcmH